MIPGSQSSDYFSDDDPAFLAALEDVVLPGEPARDTAVHNLPSNQRALKAHHESLVEEELSGDEWIEQDDMSAWDAAENGDEQAKRKRPREEDDAVYGEAHFGAFGEYMNRKRAKLQIQNSALDSTATGLFSGLAIYINGFTTPSVQVLRELIVAHGGVFHAYLDKKAMVTHILTCTLTPAKMREFQHMKVVRPDWLVDSASQGVLLPWRDFIYAPEERPDPTQGTDATPRYAAHKSNPFAQRAMAKPGWREAHTSVAPDFIQGYYKNSRLHHLSSWKAELKSLVQEAQERAETGEVPDDDGGSVVSGGVSMRGAEFVLRSPTKGKARDLTGDRVIMHCDFDCFFVSAGLLKRPELKGKPVVVCHSNGAGGGSTSEIASCSYEAREFGVKNGMSLQQARKLCPAVLTMPYEFELYKQLSLQFYTVLMTHADDLQSVSVDEALIDVSSTINRLRTKSKSFISDPAKDLAETIRTQVKRATGCEASIGIAHNILLARLATKKAKPAGSFHIFQADAQMFVATLDISDLHGFGHSAKQKSLDKLGTSVLGELASKNRATLCEALGKATGETLYNAIRGVDDRVLESDKPRKSVSCEINYGIRFENEVQAEVFVRQMAVEIQKRLGEVGDGVVGRSITVKIMKRDPKAPVEPPKFMGHGVCDVFNKQGPLPVATSDEKIIGTQAWKMLKAFNFDPREFRGIGIQITKLESAKRVGASVGSGPQQQRTLPFAGTSNSKHVEKRIGSLPPMRPPESEPEKKALDPLPAYSQVDQSVYQALPEDVRGELDQEYRQRSESLPPQRRAINPHMPFPARSRSIFLQRAREANFKRITTALAPNRAGNSPKKKANFFGKNRAIGTTAKTRLLDDELRAFGMDPEVFKALPKGVQREQLTRVRLMRTEGGIPEVTGEKLELKPRARFFSLDGIVRRLPPKARYPVKAVLRKRVAKETLKLTEAEDVQGVIEQWVGRFGERAPNEADVRYFEKFLLDSIRAEGGEGTERAVEVLRWWQSLLKRRWRELEYQTECDDESVGIIWWRRFREVRRNLDAASKVRWGYKLSIK